MAIFGFRVSHAGSRVRKFAMLECLNRLQRDSAALGTMRGSRAKPRSKAILRKMQCIYQPEFWLTYEEQYNLCELMVSSTLLVARENDMATIRNKAREFA